MRRWSICFAFLAQLLLCAWSVVRAAEIVSFAVDGKAPTNGVKTEWVPPTDSTHGQWVIGENGRGVNWQSSGSDGDGGRVELKGTLIPDPVINFNLVVFDFGAPSNFSFSFVMPLTPNFPNPSSVFDSLSGSVNNGIAAGGVTVTPLAPPMGNPVDLDGIPELQVFTLSDDNMGTWQNVGLDAGPLTFVPLAPNATGPYGAYNQGPIPTIAGGPWTHMRVDLNFSLSGGGDSFSFSGAKVLVPEPGTVALVLLSLASVPLVGRRQRCG